MSACLSGPSRWPAARATSLTISLTTGRVLSLVLSLVLGLLVQLLAATPVRAHEMSMAELHVQEVAPGRFVWQWTAGSRGDDSLVLHWPEGCVAGDGQLDCPAGRMVGRMGIDGVGDRYSAVLVKLHWLDGGLRVYTLTKGQRSVQLHGSADDKRGLGEIVQAYTVLGIEHILSGVDHLLFVITLLLLVGFERRLVWTITAFTAAHSLTLASSALGWLALRPPPVEATIALSIVLVAGEALHQRQTLARRWPALVAFLFGLVHGLGFAGALREIGLPEQHLSAALLTFNLGVEIGQLITVAVVWAVTRLFARLTVEPQRLAQARTLVLYGIGSVAAYWSIGRVAAILA